MTDNFADNLFWAHSPPNWRTDYESILQHSMAVAKKTGEFATEFGFADLGTVAGLLHDIGKYQESFQRKIRGQNCTVEHSICGAKEALSLLPLDKNAPINAYNREILAYIIAAHHSGLPDIGTEADNRFSSTLMGRLDRQTEDYSAFKTEITIDKPNKLWTSEVFSYAPEERAFALSILTRMLFSALVDADSLETEKFYSGEDRKYNHNTFDQLKQKLNTYLSSFSNTKIGSINEIRRKIQQKCTQQAVGDKGIYSLTVPTGGGKTLSSMSFALCHLLSKGHRRIIYVIPYTSIIEQTAKIFKDIFGEENVLEHHSNFNFEDESTAEETTPQFFGTENWDAPIILTTNVQFFESFFSNKRGSCRKLHNIANSVIVFDEAQMLPIPLLQPCLKAIDVLCRNFGCTALLMSATCPDYQKYLCKDAKITEINEEFRQHYIDFKRTKAEYIGTKTDQEIIDRLGTNSQTLVIVNSRKHARALFYALSDKDCNSYHLSSLMTPKHRLETLAKIKADLAENKPCVVISTSLVECGVDLDFAAVYRSLAGIDSIVQAGGRCNREGKRQNARVYIFESAFDPQNGEFSIRTSIARSICLQPKGDDLFDLANIETYFKELLEFKDDATDRKKILDLFAAANKPFYLRFNFATCNDMFRYIENSDRRQIIIPAGTEAQRNIDKLRQGKDLGSTLRKLGSYSVSVYSWEYKELQKQSKLETVGENGLSILTDIDFYDKNVGLEISGVASFDGELVV